ncbi:sporulation membrane protein YtrI [Cytobacillus sp. FSL R5-0569]|uniref:sporulation membrane protein YtrI n=1 Tax=Cytobacillus sp. FSL R5-0569 TaxID=2921649 RepID=UPI0030FC1BA4
MRIPPYYRRPSWQRFFAGMAIGGVLSWCVFVYIFGEWQERYSLEIHTQEAEIKELENEKEIWQKEFKKLNKENEELLTVQEIIVKIDQSALKKYNLDEYSLYQTEDAIKEDISILMARDIKSVGQSIELVKRIIVNKTHPINGKRYRADIQSIIIDTTLVLEVELLLN